MKDKDTRYSVRRDGLLTDRKDARKKAQTSAHSETHWFTVEDTHSTSNQAHAHRKNGNKYGWEGSQNTPGLAHVFTESATRCHFQYPCGKKHLHHDGKPIYPRLKRSQTHRQISSFTKKAILYIYIKKNLIPQLTWWGSHSLTHHIPCFLTCRRCHALHFTFQWHSLQGYGGVPSPLMAPTADYRLYI